MQFGAPVELRDVGFRLVPAVWSTLGEESLNTHSGGR